MVVRGAREETRAEALGLLEGLGDDAVAWVSREEDVRFVHAEGARSLLGRAFDAVVIDLHDGLDADVLGQCQGLVWGGGCLVLRMPEAPPPQPALVTYPFSEADVGTRFWRRLERGLGPCALAPILSVAPLRDGRPTPAENEARCRPAVTSLRSVIAPAAHDASGTASQRALTERLAETFTSETPALAAILADRGRGKSSALGLALKEALSRRPLQVALTAPSAEAALEVLRFAPEGAVGFVPLFELARGAERFDVIVVDEAAQLPVPLLTRLVRRHPRAHIAFASTVHGYEGTGRGFSLRFLAWAEEQPRPLLRFTLEEPIRWAAGDPLERTFFDILALDAEPAHLDEVDLGELEHVVFDRDRLAENPRTLRELFGLLVQAHYRTTPSDLHRLLDAPNLAVHALLHRGQVVAATLVAMEGGLSPELSSALARGATRIRGHALADTLVCHSSRPDAGPLSMVRSVRIAVHPELRRHGLASTLVEHVHRTYAPDLFGTLFGATPEVLRFRRSLGYELVRVGVSRGARTGEPAAVMVRAVSPRAVSLVSELRGELARELPLSLELLELEGELSPALKSALSADLPAAPPLTDDALRSAVKSYLEGPRPYESAAFALTRFVEENAGALAELGAQDRALIDARIRERRAWAEAAVAAGYPSVPAAMRALRRALRALAAQIRR